MEITSSSAKLKILLNGLQPLTKESMVDFPDGSEALISLEYNNLKNHCSHCQRITHEKKTCPGLQIKPENQTSSPLAPMPHGHESKGASRNYYTPRDNFVAPRNHSQDSVRLYSSQRHHDHRQVSQHPKKGNSAFCSESQSVSQRQREFRERPRNHQERYKRSPSRDYSTSYHSRRDKGYPSSHKKLLWKEKTPPLADPHREVSDSSRTRRPPLERTTLNEFNPPTPPPIPTNDEVMGEIREVTLQYTNCADPTESAARRRRVLQGEAQNLMAETAANMIEAATLANQTYQEMRTVSQSNNLAEPVESLSHPPGFSSPAAAPAKNRRGRPPLNKSPLRLTGAKSSKRNKCTIQSSPNS